MRWIDMSEIEMIKEWSYEENTEAVTETYLPQPDSKKESYWTKSDFDKNIMEYDFHSVPELSELLKTELRDEVFEDLILPLTVAVFKEKSKTEQLNGEIKTENKEVSDKSNDELTIPEFVYVF